MHPIGAPSTVQLHSGHGSFMVRMGVEDGGQGVSVLSALCIV
jgi:hypothetical protein